MRSLGKRGAGIETETLVKIILLVVFLFVAASIIVYLFQNITVQDFKTYGCWAANAIMASNIAFRSYMEVPCKNDIIEKAMSKQELAIYLTDVWFMYGKGSRDYHVKASDSVQVSAFMVNENMKIRDIFAYLITHKGKTDLIEDGVLSSKDLEKSSYNELQTGSKGQTLCFHESLGQKDAELKKNKVYFLLYWDDLGGFRGSGSGDKLVISTKSSIGEGAKAVACCTLREGWCYRLTGEQWFDFGPMLYSAVFEGGELKMPGTAEKTTSGGMFTK